MEAANIGKKNILLTFILIGFISSCVDNSLAQHISAETVYQSIVNNGLEAPNPCLMPSGELMDNGISCRNAQFSVPSIGEKIIGSIYECENMEMMDELIIYLLSVDNYRSWLIVKGDILLVMAGELDGQRIQMYANAIPGNGNASILPPNMPNNEFTPTYTMTNTEYVPTNTKEIIPTETTVVLPTVTNTSVLSPTVECNPSYPGVCLRNGIGDYDCLGGSGDGPNYIQGPIIVLPPDPFELDADHDGWGCN